MSFIHSAYAHCLMLLFWCPCSFLFLSVPWAVLEKPAMMVAPNLKFDFWVFFTNALCALALNFSVFLVIGRTGAITVRVAGVLKDWILIGLSTILFPDSKLTVLNILGYSVGIYSAPNFILLPIAYCRVCFLGLWTRYTKHLILCDTEIGVSHVD